MFFLKFAVKLGKKHPDQVVETASLSSVEPTDVWYKLSIPEETIQSGALSALQLESITYASQQHEQLLPGGTRAGFLIGDGAGVGKGRTIAGIIYENYMKDRRRAIWVSVSNDLKYDAERDLEDIGAGKIKVLHRLFSPLFIPLGHVYSSVEFAGASIEQVKVCQNFVGG